MPYDDTVNFYLIEGFKEFNQKSCRSFGPLGPQLWQLAV
jgi:hypothetical protein